MHLLIQKQRMSLHLVTLFTFFNRGYAVSSSKLRIIFIKLIPGILSSVDINYIFYLMIIGVAEKEREIKTNLVTVIVFPESVFLRESGEDSVHYGDIRKENRCVQEHQFKDWRDTRTRYGSPPPS